MSIKKAQIADISNLVSEEKLAAPPITAAIKTTTELCNGDIVIDIRSQDEQEENPLTLINNVIVKKLPFYKLVSCFGELDRDKSYLIYCDRGIMSRLQAIYLREQGFQNVKVYNP